MYIEETLHHYLDDLASAQPAPGGGSTAALSGAMGAALASMVCRITLGKDAYADVRQEIEELLGKTENLRRRFQQLMQEDIEAYGHLATSYKLPKETSEERKYRTDMLQKQLVEAAMVPLDVVECAAELIKSCQRIAEIGSANVLSDVATGAILASCSGKGASFMVRINVQSMKNEKLALELEERLNSALRILEAGVDQVTNIVGSRA
ncbi:MAG TPA: cyclodeaminase/cyclohydrolase family protein [Ktedonobacteraceae bacterium]|nr:cyclodeaminase/cyclohydrolase family protein [Ktedonobacteraceae bacterium]